MWLSQQERRLRAYRAAGWIDFDGEITAAGEAEMEARQDPDRYIDDAPLDMDPEPYPGGSLV